MLGPAVRLDVRVEIREAERVVRRRAKYPRSQRPRPGQPRSDETAQILRQASALGPVLTQVAEADRGRQEIAGTDTHVMRRTLSELERDLGDEQFIRIHRSIIVNLDRIHGLELQDGGEYEVVLKSRSGCSIAWVRDRTRPVER